MSELPPAVTLEHVGQGFHSVDNIDADGGHTVLETDEVAEVRRLNFVEHIERILLAHFGKEGRAERVVPSVNQENLAQMIGTTRSRVSHFMNKFRKLGFVDYSGNGGLTVNSGLLSIILHD